MADYTLAVDPSINRPGYAVFSEKTLVEYGVLKTWAGSVRTSDQARLHKLLCDVGSLCYRFSPKTVVIEDYQFRYEDIKSRNKDQIKKMIWSIGVVMVAVPPQYDTVLFKPHEWKGRKTKDVTVLEAKAVYSIPGPLDNNAADAIMLGHHFLQGAGNVELVQRRGSARSRRSANQRYGRKVHNVGGPGRGTAKRARGCGEA